MSEAQESKKRNRKRFCGGGTWNKRFRGTRELEVGMQGILITCNMNEKKCTAEAFNLLTEYADKLYGPENGGEDSESGPEEEEDDDDDDAEAALKQEVSQLRSSSRKHQTRFRALDSGAKNVLFIRTTNLEPDKLVHHILSDLHTSKKKKTRVIMRMLPVSGTCRAFQEDMDQYLAQFLEPWFKAPNSSSYQIAFKARNSSHNKRDDVIDALAGLVDKMNPKNKVDLTNPDLTIIVQVIKLVCCVSVVPHYTLLRKYNLQEVIKDDTPKQEETSTTQEVSATKQEVIKDDTPKQEETSTTQEVSATKQEVIKDDTPKQEETSTTQEVSATKQEVKQKQEVTETGKGDEEVLEQHN